MVIYKLLVRSVKQVVQVTSKSENVLTGSSMRNLSILQQEENGEGYSILVNRQVIETPKPDPDANSNLKCS